MPQVRKPEMRDAFVAAAAQAFAELGFAATSMADVAARADSSVGNLYKYFSSKQQLFDAAVPPELVQELTRRTRARIRALGSAKDVRELHEGARYQALSGDLLDYCLANRAAVVVVLVRAEGTPFSSFAEQFVQQLCGWALDYARVAYPTLRTNRAFSFVLQRAYRGFVTSVAEALQAFPDDAEARRVIALLTAQHQGGLKRLFEVQGEIDAQSHSAGKPPVVTKAARARARNTRATSADPSPAGAGAGQAHRPGRSRRRR
ncbi:MAG TPA: helix-turn-helix domain-containing protein [Polyangiaceae bacterium]|nr:helix-turn-helix domain-containing protein [Polyangiaceae bacterium]